MIKSKKRVTSSYVLQIVAATEANRHVYLNLLQCYEAEFSAITLKKPDADGLFELDTQLGEEIKGLLLMVDGRPAAIAAIALKGSARYEVCEFYVVPSFRNSSTGMRFAHLIWTMYPGEWEIKQIAGAEYASRFWRKSITAFEQTAYEEDRFQDPYWGIVTRQRFRVG
jgi:predicted acetyltransferase